MRRALATRNSGETIKSLMYKAYYFRFSGRRKRFKWFIRKMRRIVFASETPEAVRASSLKEFWHHRRSYTGFVVRRNAKRKNRDSDCYMWPGGNFKCISNAKYYIHIAYGLVLKFNATGVVLHASFRCFIGFDAINFASIVLNDPSVNVRNI